MARSRQRRAGWAPRNKTITSTTPNTGVGLGLSLPPQTMHIGRQKRAHYHQHLTILTFFQQHISQAQIIAPRLTTHARLVEAKTGITIFPDRMVCGMIWSSKQHPKLLPLHKSTMQSITMPIPVTHIAQWHDPLPHAWQQFDNDIRNTISPN